MYNPIKVIITPEMIKNAQSRDHGAYNNRSFMKGEGNIVGFLGEAIVQYLKPNLKQVNTYDCDFTSNGYNIEVKTKHQSVPHEPKGYYEASIDVNSLHQKTDFYVFCRIYKESPDSYPYGWILGWVSKKNFLKNARRLKKGSLDGDNGYIVKQDCLNLKYDQLESF